MNNGIIEQLKGLERERARLDALLAHDANWAVYYAHIKAAPGRPETEVARELVLPASVADSLNNNRLFRARRKLLDAIELLEDLLARPGSYPVAQSRPDPTTEIAGSEAAPSAHRAAADEPASGPPPEPIRAADAAGAVDEADRAEITTRPPSQPDRRSESPVAAQPPAHAIAAAATGQQGPHQVAVADTVTTYRHPPPFGVDGTKHRRKLTPFIALGAGAGRTSSDTDAQNPAPARGPSPRVEGQPAANRPAPIAVNTDHPDSLLSIKGLTLADREILAAAGLVSFDRIAALRAVDVDDLRQRMPDGRRISSGQWIEQAAMLAGDRMTAFARARSRGISSTTIAPPDETAWEPRYDRPQAPNASDDKARRDDTGYRQVGLSDRIARLEQTISTIVMPDLKRPPPAIAERAKTADQPRQEQPPPPPLVMPAPIADINDPEIEPTATAEGVAARGQPSPPPPLTIADRGDHRSIDDTHADEADVKIVKLEPTQDRSAPAATADQPPPIPQPQADRIEPAQANWSTADLARSLERVSFDADEEEDFYAVASRFTSDVEEASVEIVRRPAANRAAAASPPTPSAERPTAPAAERPTATSATQPHAARPASTAHDPTKSRRNKFLGALTGRRESG